MDRGVDTQLDTGMVMSVVMGRGVSNACPGPPPGNRVSAGAATPGLSVLALLDTFTYVAFRSRKTPLDRGLDSTRDTGRP